MDQNSEFNDIAPFGDEDASAGLSKVANHPAVPWVSKYIFPNQPETYLRDILRSIKTVDQFQSMVMSKAVEWVIETTVKELSYDGLETATLPCPITGISSWTLLSHRSYFTGTAFP